jgi:ankyrin repeat protein
MNQPEVEDIEDLLLACRYGDLEDVQEFVKRFGPEPLKTARDDRGNNVVHMCCGNGHAGKLTVEMHTRWKPVLNSLHLDILEFILPFLPSSELQALNDSKSPPLHWAILNNHVNCTKLLSELPEEKGGGLPMLEVSE